MSKLKQGNPVPGTTRLRQQFIHKKEIAPIYRVRFDQTLLAAEKDAKEQAELAGYRAVCVCPDNGRPHQSSVYLLFPGNDWRQTTWALGKWGKLYAKDPGGIFKPLLPASQILTFTDADLSFSATATGKSEFPLAGVTGHIEIVSPILEFTAPELEAAAIRLTELLALDTGEPIIYTTGRVVL